MPSDAFRHSPSASEILRDTAALLRASLETPQVKLSETDGRWRPYERAEGGFVLCAFTLAGKDIVKSTYGLDIRGGRFTVIYRDFEEAEAKAKRLNVRL